MANPKTAPLPGRKNADGKNKTTAQDLHDRPEKHET